jgi:hypothetical protein
MGVHLHSEKWETAGAHRASVASTANTFVLLLLSFALPFLITPVAHAAVPQHAGGCHEHHSHTPSRSADYACCQLGHGQAVLQETATLCCTVSQANPAVGFETAPANFFSHPFTSSFSISPPNNLPLRI